MKPATDDDDLGLTGKGVEIPKIKALDEALKEYQAAKKKRIAATAAEVPLKEKVIKLLEKHKERLTIPASGDEPERIVYRNGHHRVEMTTAKVSLKVGEDEEEEEEEEGAK